MTISKQTQATYLTVSPLTGNPAIRTIVENALREDLEQGDVTTDLLPILSTVNRTANIRTRQGCVVSGMDAATLSFFGVDASLSFVPFIQNGDKVEPGTVLATVSGNMASILKAERTALNFLQHLSGIATHTREYTDALEGTGSRITNTRKTTPGLRILEQMAVRHGGGSPHRYNLGSCVMLKDNHWQALCGQGSKSPDPEQAITDAILLLRQQLSHTMKIEVEVDRLEQIPTVLEAGADIILLDNMTPTEIREALGIIQGRAIAEASGGISLHTVREYGLTGVPYISTSKITLGVPAIDIGLDLD